MRVYDTPKDKEGKPINPRLRGGPARVIRPQGKVFQHIGEPETVGKKGRR
jgi:hypothetical protein